jgi:hypothetical protein
MLLPKQHKKLLPSGSLDRQESAAVADVMGFVATFVRFQICQNGVQKRFLAAQEGSLYRELCVAKDKKLTLIMNYRANKKIASSVNIRLLIGIWLILAAVTNGCTFTNQFDSTSERAVITLGPNDLENDGIGFLTPSTATGRESDKQALAMSFSLKLQEMRPDVTVLSLPHVLNAMNAADLDVEYKQMYRDYRETGILEGSILQRISDVAGVRYFAQLSLAGFRQTKSGRFSFLGLRISHTEVANLRVFVQIWDAQNAEIAWEGYTELSYAYDTSKEMPVTFSDISQLAAEQLFSELPGINKK